MSTPLDKRADLARNLRVHAERLVDFLLRAVAPTRERFRSTAGWRQLLW